MVIITRHQNEGIAFPDFGIHIHLRHLSNGSAQLAIDVPPDIRVFREESIPLYLEPTEPASHPSTQETVVRPGDPCATTPVRGPDYPSWAARPAAADAEHKIRNALNTFGLAVHLARKQAAAGQADRADGTLAKALRMLESFDADVVVKTDIPTGPRRTALLVEDNANERELLAGVLQMNGCECATAGDGEEALAYLASHPQPDVMLLDLGMPRCDGRETVRRVRTMERHAGLRVFTVSGTDPRSLGIPIGAGGVDGWFRKPLNPTRLWEAIQQTRSAPILGL